MDFDVPGVVKMSSSKKLSELPELATGPGASGGTGGAVAKSSTRADPPRSAEVNSHLYAARDARREKRWADAIKSYEAAVKLAPEDSRLHDNTAWFLLTVDDEKQRDPTRAVELATRAVELTEENSGQYLGTLAEALHSAGDLDGAVKRAEAAAKLDPHPERKERAERYRKELEECRARSEAKAKASDPRAAPAAKRKSALPEWPPRHAKASKASKASGVDKAPAAAPTTTTEAADTAAADTTDGTPTWAIVAIALAGLACAGGVALALRRRLGALK